MNIITGYKGTPHITAAQDGDINQGICGASMVLNVGSQFSPTVLSNTQLQIADGTLVMQGRAACIENGNTEVLTMQNPTQGQSRIDLVVARYTKDGTGVESIELAVLTGSEHTPPSYAEGSIRDGDTTVEVPLYQIQNNAGTGGSIYVSNITTADAVAWGMDDYFRFPGAYLNLAGIQRVEDEVQEVSDALGSLKCYGYVNVTSSSPQTFSFSGTMRGILIAEGNAANSAGMYLINGVSSRYAADAVKAASNLTVAVSSGQVKVTTTASSACHLWMICLEGSGDWE